MPADDQARLTALIYQAADKSTFNKGPQGQLFEMFQNADFPMILKL